jgi:hypothetical protein
MATVGKATAKKSNASHASPSPHPKSTRKKSAARSEESRSASAKDKGKKPASSERQAGANEEKAKKGKSSDNSASALLALSSPVSISTAGSSGASFVPNLGNEISKVADGAGKWGAGVTQNVMDMLGGKGESSRVKSGSIDNIDDEVETSAGNSNDESQAEVVYEVSNVDANAKDELNLKIQSKNVKTDTGKIGIGQDVHSGPSVDVELPLEDQYGLPQNNNQGDHVTSHHKTLDHVLSGITVDSDGFLKTIVGPEIVRAADKPKKLINLEENLQASAGVITKIPNLAKRNNEEANSSADERSV